MFKTTKIIHAWRDIDLRRIKPIVTPLFTSVPYEYPVHDVLKVYDVELKYSREENPTVYVLERSLSLAEDCKYGLAFSTGMAAISTLFLYIMFKKKKLYIYFKTCKLSNVIN